MCGIVGLFLKDKALEPKLGEMLSGMLDVMCDRGPDSAGFAVYGSGESGKIKLTLRAPEGFDFAALGKTLGDDVTVSVRGTHAVVSAPAAREAEIRAIVAKTKDVAVVGAGQRMELFKEVGLPSEVAERFELSKMTGTHGIGHTRMATESAVTTNGAHPFSTGADQCLVHNGSLSNHRSVRRDLDRAGVPVQTDNDSEVAAGYLTWRMNQGRTLGEALEDSLDDLDGFYTFVVGTETGFGVIRDPIACKPAVMAETDQYVAFGSEYRALAGLPGIENAKVWEPEPAKAYFWDRAAA
ncbi:glutamine amidotransferase family protein [Chelatococcus sambhunathii]|uniref:Glutamine amidotransferase family protein n=1 Tax=Chelatococcus sambhunathii TaxID=363953 RepID=A0ABU1DK11_9HYPH|nr:glutamine amidotransferase family protein [Chelatococcus sambhunathii]MDR4308225.1 glutamine amidotransferase family protein [Chelatococcus sambhunathii]